MRRALIVFLLLIAACSHGRTPTQPSETVVTVPQELAGRWRGLFEITACSGVPADCSGRTTAEFMFTLVQVGAGLEGVLVLLDNERTTVNVSGAPILGGGYAFVAPGDDQPTQGTYPVRTVVLSLECRTDVAGLVGSMTYRNEAPRAVTRTVVFRSALRQPAVEHPGYFDGAWQGYYRTLSCNGDCQVGGGGYNAPTGGSLSMTYSDAGGRVVGTVLSLPVSGAAQADALSATGSALTVEACATCWDCEGVCQTAVQNVKARVDKLGRMMGTFEYSRKGWTGSQHFRQFMQVEMVGVTRRW